MKPSYHSTAVHILMKPIPFYSSTHTNEAYTILQQYNTNEASYHYTAVHILMKPIPFYSSTHTNEAYTILQQYTY